MGKTAPTYLTQCKISHSINPKSKAGSIFLMNDGNFVDVFRHDAVFEFKP